MTRFDTVLAGTLIGPLPINEGHPLMELTEIKSRLSAVACLGNQGDALAGEVKRILESERNGTVVVTDFLFEAPKPDYEAELQRAYDDGYAKGEEDARGNFVGEDEQEIITNYVERTRLFTAETVDDLIVKVASEQAGPKIKSVLNDLRERFTAVFENSGTEVA